MVDTERKVPGQDYLEAAKALAAARVRYAQRFLLWKGRGVNMTDGHAHQAAIEDTKAEITILEAELEVAKAKVGLG